MNNQELERLAKLGKALEFLYSKRAVLIYDIKENRKGEIWYCNRIKTLEEVFGVDGLKLTREDG